MLRSLCYVDRVMTQDVEPAAPKNVFEAIAAVMREIPGIGKDSQAAEQQGSYKYRGIEAITAEIQKLLGKYGVVFIGHETGFQINDLIVNGKPWTDTILTIEYDVFGPGGPDDMIAVGPIHAVGRDNSDKGANKARTQAFKYALLHTFCIGDSKDDADGTNQEADSKGAAPPPSPQILLATRIKALSDDDRAKVKSFVDANSIPALPNEWDDEHLKMLGRKVDALEHVASGNAPAPETPPPPKEEAAPTTDAETGGPAAAGEPPVSPPAESEWDRDSLLAGITAYEERLDETTFPIYTAWLTDIFGGENADITKFADADLEQVWRKLDELTTEGAPAT